jgi:hypothetical protein
MIFENPKFEFESKILKLKLFLYNKAICLLGKTE